MRDARRIHERREITLERMQVVWLALGTVVALGLMFASGVVVGRRAADLESREAQEKQLGIADMDAEGERHQELTFYDRLTAPPKPMLDPAPTEAPTASETPRAAAEEKALGDASRPRAANVPPPHEPEGHAEKPLAETQGDSAQLNAEPTAQVSRVRHALDAGPPPAGDYTVQVSAFQSVAEAKAFSASLERKGYKPFVVSAEVRGKGTWYRVRLGSFENKDEARAAKELLAQANIPGWVLRAE